MASLIDPATGERYDVSNNENVLPRMPPTRPFEGPHQTKAGNTMFFPHKTSKFLDFSELDQKNIEISTLFDRFPEISRNLDKNDLISISSPQSFESEICSNHSRF
jgi:hypothetical protein